MSAPQVSLLAHRDYDPEAVLITMRRLLEPLGGMASFVSPNARVILKPNLVFGRHPDKAINTHPSILRAAAILVREAGAKWIGVGDSPGFGSSNSAAKAAGLTAVADEFGLEVIEFAPLENIDTGRTFVRLELARELLEADVIINLPKMKSHGQMLMTLAVKNMFGAVVGARKLQWHYRAGRDRLLFARAINEIAMAVRPHLSILDGIVGMDGLGPSAGRARPVGLLAASSDPWALDAVIMDTLGLPREALYTLAAASAHGPREWRDLEIVGDAPGSLKPDDWQLPELCTLQMHGDFVEKSLPRLASWLRKRISPRPVPSDSCIACGHCVAICPARAMRLEKGKVAIDEAVCIRCYCCHELCQYDGMDMRSGGLLAKLLRL